MNRIRCTIVNGEVVEVALPRPAEPTNPTPTRTAQGVCLTCGHVSDNCTCVFDAAGHPIGNYL